MKKYFPFLIVGFVALVTLTSGTLLYRAKRTPGISLKGPAGEPERATHILGPPNATVTLEEFGDFQCPPCGALSEPLNQLSHDFPQLRIVFKNFPLPVHQHADEAARAAEAAGLQDKFWKMHDLLYREQGVWSKVADFRSLLNEYAGTTGCDVERFNKDMESEAVAASVKADQEEGTRLGVKNTPTIFLNNNMVPPPALDPKDLRGAVEALLHETAATTPAEGAANL
jgi:protein-disulfide isomerase